METLPESGEPVLERAQPVEMCVNARSIHLHTVLLKAEAINLDGIRMIPVPQFDGVAHFTANLRAVRAGPKHRTVSAPP